MPLKKKNSQFYHMQDLDHGHSKVGIAVFFLNYYCQKNKKQINNYIGPGGYSIKIFKSYFFYNKINSSKAWNSPEVDGISSGDKITGYIALTEDPMVYQIVSDFNGQ